MTHNERETIIIDAITAILSAHREDTGRGVVRLGINANGTIGATFRKETKATRPSHCLRCSGENCPGLVS